MNSFDPAYNSNYGLNPSWHRLNTNMYLVTSLEEALMKTTVPNSDMVYFHQDQNLFYRVKVDLEGRKSWAQFSYIVPDVSRSVPATVGDLKDLEDKIMSFIKEAVNGEFNGQNTVSTSAAEQSE